MELSLAQEIVQRVKVAKKIALAMHRHPDPDSVGAAAAFGAYVEAQGITPLLYCIDGFPQEAQFFGVDPARVIGKEELMRQAPDLICTFDAGDPKYAGVDGLRRDLNISSGKLQKIGILHPDQRVGVQDDNKRHTPFIVNFDHHATNTQFGDLNVVDSSYASTTEIIYEFFTLLNFPISHRVALHLMAGLLNDTDHFFNPATSGDALHMASVLLTRGVTLPSLRRLMFEQRSLASLKLMGEILARLAKSERYDIAVTYITDEDLERHGLSFDDMDGVANILNMVGDAKATLVLKSSQGSLRGSFRTTREDVNLGRLAEMFGGGGHRKAAGFTIKGRLITEGGALRVI